MHNRSANQFAEFNRSFWSQYDWYLRDNEQRRGQSRMNALLASAPELYELIRNTDADCFYDDDLIDAFDIETFGSITNR